MRRSWVLAVALAMVTSGLFPVASAHGLVTHAALPVNRLQQALEHSLRVPDAAPGVSAAVMLPDGRTWTGVAGFADARKRRRVTRSTPFAVASVTKTVVAAVALRLAERGAMDLDSPVARWYPEARAFRPRHHAAAARSYQRDRRAWPRAPPPEPSGGWTPAALLARARAVCEPATCFVYSDDNFVAAAEVIKAATGSSVARLARRELFEPLGMHHTWFQAVERPRGHPATGFPAGAFGADNSSNVPSTEFVTRTGYTGSLATTARDLATWGRGIFRGDVLQRTASRDAMVDFDRTGDLPCPVIDRCPNGYGLGMELASVRSWTAWQHSGSTGALLNYFPQRGITIAVLTTSVAASGAGPFPAMDALVAALPQLHDEGAAYTMPRRRIRPGPALGRGTRGGWGGDLPRR